MALPSSSGDQFPRAILHVDGDFFFVSCELASKPWLKGRPVVTGHERGIATAMSPEAKALGISRGMPVYRIRKLYPQTIVLSSDYDSYELYARRMYAVVRRYTPLVQEYSVDECFADLTGRDVVLHMSYEEIARSIKHDLEGELGLSFSVGVSVNKVAAKVASKWHKPSGLTLIPKEKLPEYLAKVAIGKIWGIGRNTAMLLRKQGIVTALDFIRKDAEWVNSTLARPYRELYQELNGVFILPLDVASKHEYVSMSRTRTFTPPSADRRFVYAQLSKNVESACAKLRRYGFLARWFSFFLKTQEFRYYRLDMKLPRPVSTPHEILPLIRSRFNELFRSSILYRATGITLGDLITTEESSGDLFDLTGNGGFAELYRGVDRLARKYGDGSVFLASSFAARPAAERKIMFYSRRRIGIPFLGQAA